MSDSADMDPEAAGRCPPYSDLLPSARFSAPTGTDGDEFTVKDGIKVSKFSKEAMEIGFDVGEELKRKVFDQFTSYVGEDSVFPTKNGCQSSLHV
jgi:hypothetical protein